ncbi:class I SAM-dependent methyltransferase [Rhodococcus sp. D2-41]|uniref:class I SAM-dependent methyltransferase n=1 Tax=Speluncibacter jeojiensis TaxID=2710754 RepID=UPI00240F39DC|nr:class I SAM-dependent methyltransferase [Rhodococcus sp. D2-41]MDG3011168.1 class I SAM-dependent methyltransferase [Rhodococcus sp. D2-41]
MTHTHAHPGHHHHPHDDADLAEILDLDGAVFGPMLDRIIEWVHGQVSAGTRRIVDLGAGTGTGTVALARRFPTAEITAVDASPVMLDRLGEVAHEDGLSDRVRTVAADLDESWPPVGQVDLAWAALSLHHVADPDRVLRDVHAALVPGGAFAAVEMDALPRVLPDDIGLGRPGLETRCHQASAQSHEFDVHPNWRAQLEAAGFTPVEQRTFDAADDPAPSGLAQYARATLHRYRTGLSDMLSAEDLGVLDRLLDIDGPDSVLHRDDLAADARRTVWVAHHP